MNKIFKVARFEFLVNLKRWEFLLLTFGLPLLIFGIILLVSIPQAFYFKQKMEEKKSHRWGIVDESGLFIFPRVYPEKGAGRGRSYDFIIYKTPGEAETALSSGKIEKFCHIHRDYIETGQVDFYSAKREVFDIASRGPLEDIILDNLLRGKIDREQIARIKRPLVTEEYVLDRTGKPTKRSFKDELSDFWVPYAFMMLLVMSLVTSSGYLVRGLSEEKENKIMEILLTSCQPRDLFIGKILGLGGLGLFQLCIWLSMGLPGIFFALPFIKISFSTVLVFIIFFILAFLFYSGIAAGVGAIGTSEKESNQILSILMLLEMTPVFFLVILVDSPNGTLARILSLIPFTAPMTIVMRWSIDKVPLWEMAAAILIMLISIYLVLGISIKIFRLGLLMYGKRPGVREIYRWLKKA